MFFGLAKHLPGTTVSMVHYLPSRSNAYTGYKLHKLSPLPPLFCTPSSASPDKPTSHNPLDLKATPRKITHTTHMSTGLRYQVQLRERWPRPREADEPHLREHAHHLDVQVLRGVPGGGRQGHGGHGGHGGGRRPLCNRGRGAFGLRISVWLLLVLLGTV